MNKNINILKNVVISICVAQIAKSDHAKIHQIGSEATINGIVLSLSSGEKSSSTKIQRIIFIWYKTTETKNIIDQKNKSDLSSEIPVIEIIKIDKTESQIKILLLSFDSIKKENQIDQIIVEIARMMYKTGKCKIQ